MGEKSERGAGSAPAAEPGSGAVSPGGAEAQATANPPYVLEQELPARLVVLGDLNAQERVLRRHLVDLRLMKPSGAWCGGRTVFVQMGDVANRGGGARAAMDLLIRLRLEARAAGGDVIWILGNHEVMSVFGHEAYVTADEYMEFASKEEIDHFHFDRLRYIYELLGPPDVGAYVEPFGGRLRAWEEENAPGRAEYRAAMGLDGRYGRYIMGLPVAVRYGSIVFVHGGLSPRWASAGLEGLTALATREWNSGVRFYQALSPDGLFRDPLGPLWHRAYCVAKAPVVRRDLEESLRLLGAAHMIVGHTRSDAVEGGTIGAPCARHRGRLIMTDVGIGDPGEMGAAVVVERGRIEVHSIGGARSRLATLKKA